MSRVNLVINGGAVSADVEPRLHLADFLREHLLLTGTHLGCEHGVCGACTILIDGAPARSCIAFTAACEGADVRTIEGIEHDPIMQRLRTAFTAEHALQCGYCTPGMLVTARDIVLRLPNADDTQIRLELAGNLCRCTGYAGIVRAIQRVLNERIETIPPAAAALPTLAPIDTVALVAPTTEQTMTARAMGPAIELNLRIARPLPEVWEALHDPALLVDCVPGARLVSVEDARLSGEMKVTLGPVTALFKGVGLLVLVEENLTATLTGEASDMHSRTRLSGESKIALQQDGPVATRANVAVSYNLRGPLAQIAQGRIVRTVANEIAATVAETLERKLIGERVSAPARLSAFRLLARVSWRRIRRFLRLR
jgi:aerobic carbon-monoxide dehydrogenase small subunit